MKMHRTSDTCRTCSASVERVTEDKNPCGVCEGRVKIVDGGRKEAGRKGHTGDCVTRAVCVATGFEYQKIYDLFAEQHKAHNEKKAKYARKASRKRLYLKRATKSASKGIPREVYELFLKSHGWKWKATTTIGSGTTTRLNPRELPKGKIIARVSRHLVAVIDGVVHDTYDCTRGGKRAVYGYFYQE